MIRAAVLALLGGCALADAAERQPISLIPAESLICWISRPEGQATPPASSQPSAIAALIDVGTRLAGQQTSTETQLVVRALEALGAVGRWPFALAVIDAGARPAETDPSARRVDRLRCVAVVRTQGENEALLRIIQKVINEQTGRDLAQLEAKTALGWRFYELRDSRLPAWCLISWGALDDCFIITLGDGVWEQVAEVAAGKRPSMGADEWTKSTRATRPGALVEVAVTARAMRERLDELVSGRVSRFLSIWRMADVDRVHWLLGFEGDSLYCEAHYQRDGQTAVRRYAEGRRAPEPLAALIPPESRFAVYRVRVAEVLSRAAQSWTASRGPRFEELAQAWWREIQDAAGVDVEQELLGALQPVALLHSYPPHPLRLPLAFTAVVPLREGSETRARAALDALSAAAAERLSEPGMGGGLLAITQDSSGLWQLRIGFLAAQAWTIHEERLVLSWSPTALREYLEWLQSRPGK